jgi:hypothetical protein
VVRRRDGQQRARLVCALLRCRPHRTRAAASSTSMLARPCTLIAVARVCTPPALSSVLQFCPLSERLRRDAADAAQQKAAAGAGSRALLRLADLRASASTRLRSAAARASLSMRRLPRHRLLLLPLTTQLDLAQNAPLIVAWSALTAVCVVPMLRPVRRQARSCDEEEVCRCRAHEMCAGTGAVSAFAARAVFARCGGAHAVPSPPHLLETINAVSRAAEDVSASAVGLKIKS